jgi:hydroxypyruvate reductase
VRLSGQFASRSIPGIALVAGTDGTDGPTDNAGGWAQARTWSSDAEKALAAADTGSFLERSGALFTTGPTGTNVMDLVVAVV